MPNNLQRDPLADYDISRAHQKRAESLAIAENFGVLELLLVACIACAVYSFGSMVWAELLSPLVARFFR